ADPVVAGARPKRVTKRERTECRIAARAAATDRGALQVHHAPGGEVSCAVDAVVYVDDAPSSAEPLAVAAPVPGAARIVHAEPGKPAAGPELDLGVQGRGRGTRRPAVGPHEQPG